MYLINIALNKNKNKTKRALKVPNVFHGILESSFGKERQEKRKLWTLLNSSSGTSLVILSEDMPNLNHIVSQIGYQNNPKAISVCDYDTYLAQIQNGSTYRFCLTACATKAYSNHDSGQTRGTRRMITNPDEQVEWLKLQGENNGFIPQNINIVKNQKFQFKKSTQNIVSIVKTTFTGNLTVEDKDKFIYALEHGIGRGKCYGNGLMLII